jgi:hypothetical protein
MENSINEVYQLDIVILTPLHVGSGSEKDLVKGMDYVQNEGRIYCLNQKKALNEIDISTFSSALLNRNEALLINKLAGKLDIVSDTVYEMSTPSDNDIKSFFKSGLNNEPILPGSSVKGAIRSILFKHLKGFNTNDERVVFGKADVGDEFMRFIKVSDSGFDQLKLSNTKIFNLVKNGDNWEGGWKHGGNQSDTKFRSTGFNTLYEVLPPKAFSKITLSIADKAFNNFLSINHHSFGAKKENVICKPIEFLFSIINQHTSIYIKKEIEFYSKYGNNETDLIISSFNYVLTQIPDDNTWCVLKMSAGSGFHSITGDWQFDDYTNQPGIWTNGRNEGKKKYKSRKIAIGDFKDNFQFAPMGFIRIGRKSEEELEKDRFELEARLEAETKIKDDLLKKAEQEEIAHLLSLSEERDRIKSIENQRLQKEAEEKQAEFQRLEDIRLKAEADEKARIMRLEQKIEGGLAFLSTTKDFDDAKKRIDGWIKVADVELLPENQHQYLLDALIRQYKDPKNRDKKKWAEPFDKNPVWRKIASWVGNDIANNWYIQIIK